ncbi:MAG: twin-arginine translocase subunit TatC [Deltaproteobacteria bacterium]|nr:twin-arginine translocase subunit TatC [Deltaproteobacteria bacterium]MBW2531826.1 twin-arginine translocase subunit TatC [Deltaproteobacteria bacterium]
MTLWEHLTELRRRLVYSLLTMFIGCMLAWYFREQLMSELVEPFAMAWRIEKLGDEITLHFATPAAAFIAYLKLALLGGTALASPMIFYQIWRFVAPGLYAREKRFVIPFVISSSLLFVGGGYFGWRAAFPIAFRYLLGLSGNLGAQDIAIVPTVMMGDYIDFVTRMLLAFGLIFEIPLLVFFLSIAKIINYLHLIHYGRWFVLGAFAVAAVFTPPDIASQLIMAIPMVVLYGVSILLAMIFGPKPSAAQREAYERRKARKRAAREADRKANEAERKARKASKAERKG